MTDHGHDERLRPAEFPRSARYDPQWQMANMMGPNALWLTESLGQVLPLEPGASVLDLGCGKAMSSVFLAREFGARVWAADLWIKPTENWERVREAGVTDLVCPLHVEAHDLPFAEGFFDAIVCIDAYHYFGTDELYLSYLTRFLRPGGWVGVVVPGVTEEFDEVPEHLRPHWQPEFHTFHSPHWWRRHWERTDLVEVGTADLVPDGWRHWLEFTAAVREAGLSPVPELTRQETEMLRADSGRVLGFSRVAARLRAVD
ncbi:SAM-dependent methyltransferase [Longimycelium tulufanense]|uniref:SAM-dependent methyltransferase n=1 Tax=Longimycelium tulufanense TaxID=907463 RepID=A0A8J3FUS2_9PSEU|nr:methyltransferase domain-containing protein [Longimycelium tulufanense]GGM61431.1 SAM-dependent methyltransferase [Longimycelium tulufanense]